MITAAQLLGLVEIRGADEGALKLLRVGASADSAGEKLAELAVGGTVLAAAGFVALGAAAVKMDADLQQGVNRLKTGGGDIQDTFASLRTGIQSVALMSGILTGPLTDAMYLIVSSGQRGTQAFATEAAAAQGAQIEMANVADVTKILTTLQTNWGLSTYTAAQYMDGLVSVVSHGKINLEDLSTKLSAILPIAAEFGISFKDIASAMAVETNAGMQANQSATGLQAVMVNLENPTKKATAAMKQYGVDGTAVANEMKVSLPGAFQMLIDAALKVGPEGSVPFNRAMADMIGGGTRTSKTIDALDQHMTDWLADIKAVNTAMGNTSTNVTGWDTAQSNLNVQIEKGQAFLQVMGQNIGEVLIPYVSQLLAYVLPLGEGFAAWATSTDGLAGKINQLAAFVTYLVRAVQDNGALKEFGAIMSDIGQTVGNVVNAAMLTLSGLFGTTASQAGKASDAATNVAGGFKHVLDTVKPLTDLLAWLSQQFTDAGIKGQLLRDSLVVIGSVIGGMKVAEFGISLVTAFTNAGLAAKGFGQTLLGVQTQATLTAGATTAAGTATTGLTAAMRGMVGPLGLIAAGLALDVTMLKSVADESANYNQALHDSTQYVQGFSIQNGQMTREVQTDTTQMADGTTKTVHTMVDTNLAYAKYGSVVWNTTQANQAVHTVTVYQSMRDQVVAANGAMVASMQGQMSALGGWMSNEWGRMTRTALSMSSTLSDDATANFKLLKGNAAVQMSQMDDSSKGYWNDVAQWIADHPINGVISYTMNTPVANIANLGANVRYSAGGWPDSPGGLSWTGEEGRELLYVPPGASIIPHQQSERIASGGIGASGHITLHLTLQTNGRTYAQAIIPDLVGAIRDGTGSRF
jgi:TP901 family phage tail tape measure protein